MKFELNKKYSGFVLNEIIPVSEIDGIIYDMEHEKSGARLIYLDCNDNNKVFYAAFKTLPEDSTGVFHIIEHSVLCGSKKYPVKEPFVDLLKGSMNTFLNAMTYPDKTVYPCASCNDKDFANLMSVYMDAVFAPAIYTNENIFRQEGHHIELTERDAEPIFKGVVFNEMKGAYSSVDSRIYSSLSSALFPDTPYSYSSGGDPVCIPDLTYEKFLASHKKYYHPENCILYLYGNMDVEERLSFLDREYLSAYEKTGVEFKIEPQKPVINMDKETVYQVSPSEPLDENSYLTYAVVTGGYADRERNMAYDILFDALTSTNDSPLKKIFIESGMGEDFSAYLSEGILHPYAVFKLKKTSADKKELFMSTLLSSLKDIADRGIDKTLLRASVCETEFALREGETGSGPVGLSYGLIMLNSLIYGGRPETFLCYEKDIEAIKAGLDSDGYFESLIYDLLSADHKALVLARPSHTYTEELDKKESERVKGAVNALSDEEKDALVRMNRALMEFQMSEDSEEAKATIPSLLIEDIDTKIPLLETEKINCSGVTTLFHGFNTKKISYIRLMFDLFALNEEELSYAAILAELMTNVSTKDLSTAELNTLIKLNLGGIGAGTVYYPRVDDPDTCRAFFYIDISVLDSGIKKALEIASTVINETVFDKKETETIVKQTKNKLTQAYIRNGTMRAVRRLSSYSTVSGRYGELLGGYEYYTLLSSLSDSFDSRFEDLTEKLGAVREKIFTRSGLTLSLTGSREALSSLDAELSSLSLSDKVYDKAMTPAPIFNGNEAFSIPSQVNYLAGGYNIRKQGTEFSGKMDVLCQIARLDYMWNEVRVKGGAYGAGFSIRPSGDLYASSYRDPSVEGTVKNIIGITDYLRSFGERCDDITNYIISTAAELTAPVSERDRGALSTNAYFTGVTNEMNEKRLSEALSTSVTDIVGFASLTEKIEKIGGFCVIGDKEKINATDTFTVKYDI